MFANLSSDAVNRARNLVSMTPGATGVPEAGYGHINRRQRGPAQVGRLIQGGQGRASASEDALRRNAAVAARLSSIRQS
jgi:hypothetical protein